MRAQLYSHTRSERRRPRAERPACPMLVPPDLECDWRLMRTVYVDADACPVIRDVISISRTHRTPVVIAANETQNLARFVGRDGVDTLQVGVGRDAADFAIVERLEPGDIVVTQDLGLAAMALGRRAGAISPRGRVQTSATIDMELAVRHAEQRHRRAGGRTGGPSAMDEDDRERFRRVFERLLAEPLPQRG